MAKDKITSERIIKDLKAAHVKELKWRKAAEEDFEFLLGDQWDDETKRKLEAAGAPALTINKIQPNIFLVSGIQRQNRTDFFAFPEGKEDSLEANIVTLLLKNLIKNCQGEYKISEMFEDGITCGKGFIEPMVDYTYDMITGDFKLKKANPFVIYADPNSVEYDYSDAKYMIKFTSDLTKDQLLELYSDKEKEIEELGNGKINLGDTTSEVTKKSNDQYKNSANTFEMDGLEEEKMFDLVEYYYKKYVKKYMVVNKRLGKIREVESKKFAMKVVEAMQLVEQREIAQLQQTNSAIPSWTPEMSDVKIIERVVPEIWLASLIGEATIIKDERSWTYPKWKSYPLIPFRAHWTSTPIKKTELMTQGIVRSLKDPQREFNKRRSQELRIINSQANGGWLAEDGSLMDENETWRNYSNTPGIILKYVKGAQKPEKLGVAQPAYAHAVSAQENATDMKEISGLNADLLAMEQGGTDSGRAIMLRMKQATVMIQRIFDNFGQTKNTLGRFLLTLIGEVYTIEKVKEVLGEDFIEKNFAVPVGMNGQPMGMGGDKPQMDPATGELVKQVIPAMVDDTINKILTDEKLIRYNINIGESASSETVRYANFLTLQEMARAGMQIPPSVLLEESTLSESSKKEIKQASDDMAKQQAAIAQNAAAKKNPTNNVSST